jgi:ribosomal protein S18 acetylase RimI-like enzyme
MISVHQIQNQKELTAFIKFPFKLYKNCPYWVPPITKEERHFMNPSKNPVFKNAEAAYFVAKKNGKIVGRIAAIVNWIEVNQQKKSKIRFGWYDVEDDIQISKKLLDTVISYGKQKNLHFVEGPVGFSNMDKAGLLCEGFDKLNSMNTWYHYPYQKEHLKALGFSIASEWLEFAITIPKYAESPEKIRRISKIILEKYALKVLQFKSTKELIPYVDKMFDLLNNTYNQLESFVPIQEDQINYYKEKYFQYIDPQYIKCITQSDGKLIAFAIVLPLFSKALKKANGSIFPFGFFHILKSLRCHDTVSTYLIGILPEYRQKGLNAILFDEVHRTLDRKGIFKIEANPTLKENKAMLALWKKYPYQLTKRRRTYRKEI